MAAATPQADTLQHADHARTIQLALSAALVKDVARVWPNLDSKALDKTFPDWLRLMTQLVERYHGMSSLAASIFYRDTRQAHLGIPTPDKVIHLAPTPSAEWMTKAFGYSGPGLLRDGHWQDSSALSTTQGTAVRIAQSGARDTILGTVDADPKALGYYRVTDGHPCAFCALLASRVSMKGRGSLYRSKESASFKAHNDCGCTAAPLFSRDQPLPEISARAAEVYRNRGSGPALGAFRKAWNEHLASQDAPARAA
jgi:hypothetical protein